MNDAASAGLIPCPSCGRRTVARGSKHFPFCSARCQSADLQGWLDEDYKIPGEPVRPGERERADDDDLENASV